MRRSALKKKGVSRAKRAKRMAPQAKKAGITKMKLSCPPKLYDIREQEGRKNKRGTVLKSRAEICPE